MLASADAQDMSNHLMGRSSDASRVKPRRGRGRRYVVALALGLAVLRVGLVLLTNSTVRGWIGIGLPTCSHAQISTPVAREGTCGRGQGLFGGGTVFNVVDAGHALHMPGYDVQLLATLVAPTRVSNPASDPNAYPDGQGLLVSFEISVTSRSSLPLEFDAGGGDVDLLINNLGEPGFPEIAFPDLPNAVGEPGTSIADVGAILPRGTVAGWVSFVAPIWSRSVLHQRAADLEFYRPGHTAPDYVGQVRLWKWATNEGRTALGLALAPGV